MTNEKFCRLVYRLVHNDVSALREIYEEYFQAIQYTALGITKNKSDAYDVAVNVLMRLIDYPSDPYAIHNHVGLLISMTKHEALNFVKKSRRSLQFDEHMEAAPLHEDRHALWIYDILNVLTEEEREIFTDHCIWGKRLKAVCKERGISYRTVSRIYANIKAKIKDIYKYKD